MKYIFPILFLGLLFANCKKDAEAAMVDPVVQLATDVKLIDDYLVANNLTAATTSTGLRYVVEEPGRGVPITSNSTINLLLKGYTLDGNTFDQTDDCSPYTIFLPDAISGIREGLQLFNTWGKGKLFLPSALAFGQAGSANFAPNTVLAFDVEVVEQKEFDRLKIESYIEANNLGKVESTNSGIFYKITETGTGEHPTATSRVSVTYTGYFADGEVFDLSEAPISFGLDNVIAGWQEALPLLKEGGSGTFLIPSDLAYGTSGTNSIAGNTMLIFDIKLISFN